MMCAFLLVGCGGSEATTSTSSAPVSTTVPAAGSATPLEAVTTWLDALSIGRYRLADEAVVADQFVLVLAVESYSVELYDDLVADGIDPSVSTTFWESFQAGVRGFTGADITEVEVVGERRFTDYGRSFAEVAGESPRGDLSIVSVLGEDGTWRVDLLATFGPSFAPLFNLWVDRLPPDVVHPIDDLRRQRPSLEVARDRVRPESDARADLDGLLSRLEG